MASMSMSSRERRRKRKREPTPASNPTPASTPRWSSPIPSLPYDLVMLCVARVSRLYYPTLSLVSKSFRSLVSSPELYKTRSLFGFTESCLYVCSESLGGSADWYTLCRKPDKTLKTGSSGYALARVPVPNAPSSVFRKVVAVGSNIYNIAMPTFTFLSVLPRVSILDSKSHSWIEAPSLPVELHSFSASVVDHKIYVAGLDHRLKKNSFEVFDTETQIWDSMSTSNTSVEREGIEREGMFIKKHERWLVEFLIIHELMVYYLETDNICLSFGFYYWMPLTLLTHMAACGNGAVRSGSKGHNYYFVCVCVCVLDSNESGLHYWNYNGYAIGRTRNCAGSQGCTIARAGDNVAIALQGTDANQVMA